MSETLALYALTRQGTALARKLALELGGTVHAPRRFADDGVHPFESLPELVAETFGAFDGHVFVAAAGIAVRCIAPHLKGKADDPAVTVLDQQGRFAVSLLSGHLGGANDLAVRCAAVTGGQAVITTATDTAGVPSLDVLARDAGMTIGNIERVKVVNGALLEGKPVQVFDPGRYLGAEGELFVPVPDPDSWRMGEPGVWVSWKDDCPDADALWLYPRVLMLGVGCRRGVSGDEIFNHVRNVFDAAGLSLDAVGGLASIDLKADEPGLLEAAQALDVKPVFYPKETLDAVDAPNPSGTVFRRVGVASVSEASALLLSGRGELLVEKTKTNTVTLAVAREKKKEG
ncbi:cobalamin biosynthesis protein CbiG [Pseudodesulfovibrio cashew]|uniref:Cobalamin biosynthesis protein CbiG n=2 Tax=Pseudodesulfovibrio cashew TaxID=2678688 RepID=A0A6I6JGH8_9BACT|nr:cobalamin biosynthesis protein CbiG [Pseudodesulfovibrio cashew]